MKTIILACFILILIVCIFPPWIVHHDGAFLREYSFIFASPDAFYYSIDLKALITNILVIIGFTSAVLVLVKKLK